MTRIKQLSKNLINQIAAGEVIERPSSVVKELVENSVDAGSKKVSIEITNECRNIRVADNGSGIYPDDIMLAFSKHATSKIENDEDLYNIKTLGFRGEALSSIISISKLTCITRTKDFDTGVKVICENSEVKKVETGCAIGTIMDIKDLFYNLPARLKFLRKPDTEFSYIQELVQSLAISHPEVSFSLKKYGKEVLTTSGSGNLEQTIKELFSNAVSANLKEVSKTDKISNLKISGYVSTPDFTRSSKKDFYTFINSRTVKCPIFQKAVDTAYKNLIANGKYPFVVLNLEIPPTDVDVNVHPTKKEVRYKNTNQIFNFIVTSIKGGLSNYAEQIVPDSYTPSYSNSVVDLPKSENVFVDKKDDSMYVSDTGIKDFSQIQNVSQQQFFEPKESKLTEYSENIIGQYKNTYILIEKEDGLEIVDQHIAQERYNYERLLENKNIVSQMLFVSDVLEISASEAELIKDNLDKFEKFGYEIEFLKENEIIFRKIPQILSKISPKEILSDILENIEGNLDSLEEKILRTTACKASVKAGEKLNMWQMQEIIKQWRTTKMPYTCPHGRPITHTIKHKDIAAFFERNE
ncbi:MAG: DNA mismatch repair endonuclease MutL [Clostridiaceae bacterium]|jgi:DNA mismatch repair protein MutL|nr:DNA mismatch repair endonuclease MutL [Clostridiaceae bacterium]